MTTCVGKNYDGIWFRHDDFPSNIQHDVDCRKGGCWPSATSHIYTEAGLSKAEVIQKSHAMICDDPTNVICEVTWWAHGYTLKVWRVDASSRMLFVRGSGDHALVYSAERFRFRNQVDASIW